VGSAVAAACLAAAGAASADWQVVGGGPVVESSSSLAGPYPDERGYDMKRIDGRPYVAWSEWTGHNHVVRVARLADDGGSWIPVAGVVNVDPTEEARHPSLAAGPNGVPWIAWDEVDGDGAREIRVAHLSAAGDGWVEPDGRNWEINQLPAGWEGFGRATFSASAPRLTFLGQRPYVTYMQDNPTEWQVNVARLAANGHSWEWVGRGVGSAIPLRADPAVIGGLLHVGMTSGWYSAIADRLTQDGRWEQLGDEANAAVSDPDGYPVSGAFNRIAELGGEPYVMWTTGEGSSSGQTYVTHLVGGAWQVAGGGGLGPARYATSLRAIGGRLFAARVGVGDPGVLHVSRLSDDGSTWVSMPDVDGVPADGGAVLSSVDGVPYVAWVTTDGTTNRLVVERLDGAPAPVAGDDGEGSGPGTDPDVEAEPILPPPDDPKPAPRGPCATKLAGTRGPDTLAARSLSTTVRGLAGDDRELGGPLRDCLFGDAGSDVLRGRDGEDRLYGGNGGDKLFGGPDEDALNGGPGADDLSGGPGWDVFRGGPGNDTILAADGRGENVYCGDGVDTARLDRYDRPHGCEHVRVAKG
jgi:hypothetical protein